MKRVPTCTHCRCLYYLDQGVVPDNNKNYIYSFDNNLENVRIIF